MIKSVEHLLYSMIEIYQHPHPSTNNPNDIDCSPFHFEKGQYICYPLKIVGFNFDLKKNRFGSKSLPNDTASVSNVIRAQDSTGTITPKDKTVCSSFTQQSKLYLIFITHSAERK